MRGSEIVAAMTAAYEGQDRSAADSLLAHDLSFTSPQDDHLGKAQFFERCFPTAERFVQRRTLYLLDLDAEHVLNAYEYELADGARYRNVELTTVRADQIQEIEVFFGGRVN